MLKICVMKNEFCIDFYLACTLRSTFISITTTIRLEKANALISSRILAASWNSLALIRNACAICTLRLLFCFVQFIVPVLILRHKLTMALVRSRLCVCWSIVQYSVRVSRSFERLTNRCSLLAPMAHCLPQ